MVFIDADNGRGTLPHLMSAMLASTSNRVKPGLEKFPLAKDTVPDKLNIKPE